MGGSPVGTLVDVSKTITNCASRSSNISLPVVPKIGTAPRDPGVELKGYIQRSTIGSWISTGSAASRPATTSTIGMSRNIRKYLCMNDWKHMSDSWFDGSGPGDKRKRPRARSAAGLEGPIRAFRDVAPPAHIIESGERLEFCMAVEHHRNGLAVEAVVDETVRARWCVGI